MLQGVGASGSRLAAPISTETSGNDESCAGRSFDLPFTKKQEVVYGGTEERRTLIVRHLVLDEDEALRRRSIN